MVIRKRVFLGVVIGLFLGLCGCLPPSGEAKRAERDNELRTLVKSIQDNDLATATQYARAFQLPVTEDNITREYVSTYAFVMPIHIAVRHGRIDMLKMLAEKRRKSESGITFDADARDSDGNTPIIHAKFLSTKTGDVVIRFLVSEGADINARNANMRMTALHHGADSTRREYVQLLIELGANVNLQDKYGRTPLHIVCGLEHGVTPEREAVFDILLKAKPELNIKDNDGLTPEQVAAKLGYTVYVQKLKAAYASTKK